MKKEDRLPPVCSWMRMSQDNVLDKFHGLVDAFSDGKMENQQKFIYIPGTRSDRVLLVAHADTVWNSLNIDLGYANDTVFSTGRNAKINYINKKKKIIGSRVGKGIGADDRAGCYIVWKLRESGHSILITSGEEIGCITSKFIMGSSWWRKEIAKHNFAIQFDRRGRDDIVFYDVGTEKFAEYIKSNTGYKPENGTFTDIRILCKDICGVNMSVGYFSEHTPDEMLYVPYMENTLRIARDMLAKPTPRFEFNKDELFKVKPQFKSNKKGKIVDESKLLSNASSSTIQDASMQCPFCNHIMTDEEWYDSKFSCNKCNQSF